MLYWKLTISKFISTVAREQPYITSVCNCVITGNIDEGNLRNDGEVVASEI